MELLLTRYDKFSLDIGGFVVVLLKTTFLLNRWSKYSHDLIPWCEIWGTKGPHHTTQTARSYGSHLLQELHCGKSEALKAKYMAKPIGKVPSPNMLVLQKVILSLDYQNKKNGMRNSQIHISNSKPKFTSQMI